MNRGRDVFRWVGTAVILAAAALAHDDQAILWLDDERNAIEHFFLFKLHAHVAQLDHVPRRGHVG